MSLQPQPAYVIPDETWRVARAAFPKSALGLRLVEALGSSTLMNSLPPCFPRAASWPPLPPG
jgi:hypothetical protein